MPKFWYQRQPLLTLPEILGIRKAWGTGQFTKSSLSRIYDVPWNFIHRVVNGNYEHFRED